jgi:hypothetical protein
MGSATAKLAMGRNHVILDGGHLKRSDRVSRIPVNRSLANGMVRCLLVGNEDGMV